MKLFDMSNKLTLVIKDTKGISTNVFHDYRDFLIDGKSFDEYLPAEDQKKHITHIGWLHSDNHEWFKPENAGKGDPEAVAILTNKKKSGLIEDRVIIYGCPVDEDPMCGAITAKLTGTDDEIIWSDFKYENQYTDPVSQGYEQIPEFHFSKDEYIRTFEEYLKEIPQ